MQSNNQQRQPRVQASPIASTSSRQSRRRLSAPEDSPMGESSLQFQDDYNLVYGSMILSGIGFLLPYNSFVNAVDFYQQRFEGHLIVFDISMTYVAVMLISVLLTNLMVTKVHLRWRITFGYLVALIVLFLTTIFDIILNVFPTRWSYGITLFSAGVVSFGCTVQQSSFYGYASLMPRRFTQAVMLGESCAGFIVSLNRLLTKSAVASTGPSTALFFILSSCMLMLCLVTFTLGVKSPYVRQFIHPTARASTAVSTRPLTCPEVSADEDRVQMLSREVGGGDGGVENPSFQAEMMDLHRPEVASSTPAAASLEADGAASASPAGSAAAAASVESVVPGDALHPVEAALFNVESLRSFAALKAGLHLRLGVAYSIWRYMLALGLCYLVTLSLFPGVQSEVPSCRLRDWMPVLLMALFNGCDLIGKVLAALPVAWRSSILLVCSIARFCIVPLFMGAASPRQKPHISGEALACCLTATLGLSNGYFGSVPMMLAPKTVPRRYREIAGNLMTISYSIGLTAGSGLAYWLDDLLGPIPAKLNSWQFACGLYNASAVIGR